MSEADAEDGLHGLDAYRQNERRHHIEFAFGFNDSLLPQKKEVSRFRAPPPFNLHSPRENKKEWRAAGRGVEGRRTRAPERITAESNREREYRTGTRAERAKSIEVFAKVGSSGVQ